MKLPQALLAALGGYALYEWLTGSEGDCPPPTQSVALNTKNRETTIRKYDYGPPNPAQPSKRYWIDYAKKWLKGRTPTSEEVEEFKTMRCWNCAAFDISPRMMECLPPLNQTDKYDLKGVTPNSVFGYCWMHHFKCRSERTCYTWAGGGPIKTDAGSEDWAAKYGG
jgi:hypothetical protein